MNISLALAGVIASALAPVADAQQTPGVFYNFHILSFYQGYQPAINITEPRATSTCDPVSRTCTGRITAPPGFAFTPNTISLFGGPVADPSGHEEVLNLDGQVLLDQGIAFWTLTYGGFAGNLCSQVQCLAEDGLPQTAAAINWPLQNGGTYTDYITFAQFSTLLDRPYPVPVSAGLTLRLKVTAPLELTGPVPPGAPIEATLSFLDTNGNRIVPPQVVTVKPGETASLDLDPEAVATLTGLLKVVVPVVGPPPGAASVAPLEATLELFYPTDQRGSVLAVHRPEPSEPVPSPSFGPQGLAPGQTIALLVNAIPPGPPNHPPQPCVATLSFADKSGNPIGPSMPVDLLPGKVKSLTMGFPTPEVPPGPTNRIEVQPIVTLAPAAPRPAPVISECLASAVVYDSQTGRTLSYQSGDALHR